MRQSWCTQSAQQDNTVWVLTWLRTGAQVRFRSAAGYAYVQHSGRDRAFTVNVANVGSTWILMLTGPGLVPSHVRTITISDMRRECSGCQDAA